jgi:hypothetical protein
MPKNLTPEDRWETDFQVPIPGDPRRIGPLEVLFQRLLNRTERLKNRLGAILGLPWDATPPDTLAGLARRLGTLESDAHLNRGLISGPVDWNCLTEAGVYKIDAAAFGSGAANYPPDAYPFGILLVFRSSSPAAITQVYIPHLYDNYIYFREAWSATDWSTWREVGSVAGHNSNGTYVKFGDGTLICWTAHDPASFGPENVGVDPNYRYRLKTWIYPAAFAFPPVVLASGDIADFGADFAYAYLANLTHCVLEAGRYGSGSMNVSAFYSLAVGRWK